MGRSRRSFRQHGWFHIMNRGVDRQDIFVDDVDRSRFLEFLAEAAERFGVRVHAYCLMTNHFHLLVDCPDGEVSSFVRHLASRYAEAFNYRMKREGPVFTGRFVSVELSLEEGSDADTSAKLVSRYIHRNPLDFVPIECLAASTLSSYGVYLGKRRQPDWLTVDTILSLFAGDTDRLRRFTEQTMPGDKTPALGCRKVTYSSVAVVAVVAELARVSIDSVRESKRGRRNDARLVAAHLCVSLRTADSVDLAELFQLSTKQGMRQLADRGKKFVAIDSAGRSLAERALRALRAA